VLRWGHWSLCLIGLLLSASCGWPHDVPRGSPSTMVRQVIEGPAPEFVLVDQSGQPLALQDLRGKVVLLTFISRPTSLWRLTMEERQDRRHVPPLVHMPVWPVIGYSPLWSQSRNVSVTRISWDPAPAGLIRIPRIAYQRLLTSQRVMAR
jgi:hypothetical protein